MPPSVTLRPATPADREFLFQVYAASRAEELAPVPWSAEEKSEFLRQQFAAQDRAYRNDYAAAAFDVIELEARPVGRLYVDRTPTEIHLIDIALLPECRGQGIGTALVREVVDEAARTKRPIRLYVEHGNPARRLYQRLGFAEVEEHGPYWRLEWSPTASPTAPT